MVGLGRARRGVPASISRRPLVTILFPLPPLRRQGAMMAGHARVADGGHALAGKWPRRLMGALLALAPNPIDTRAFATRALATAPESAGIGDMQGKATPGLGPWAGASPLPGRMLPLPRRRPRRMRRTKGSRQGRSRIGSMRKSRLRMRWRRPCGRRTTIGGGSWHSRGTLQCSWYGCGRLLYGGVRRYDPRVLPQQGQYQVRVDKEGITRVYDAARNLFGAYNPDGTTKSYLAPTGGQAYFDNQGWAMP